MQNAVRVEDEPADVRLPAKISSTPVHIGAFRQPDAARVAPEATAVMVARGEDLRADGRRMIGQQRQQRVRGGAGDDFQRPASWNLRKARDEIAVAGVPGIAAAVNRR